MGMVLILKMIANLYWIRNMGRALSYVFYIFWVFLLSQQPHEVGAHDLYFGWWNQDEENWPNLTKVTWLVSGETGLVTIQLCFLM